MESVESETGTESNTGAATDDYKDVVGRAPRKNFCQPIADIQFKVFNLLNVSFAADAISLHREVSTNSLIGNK
jgi:hypothetical protein